MSNISNRWAYVNTLRQGGEHQVYNTPLGPLPIDIEVYHFLTTDKGVCISTPAGGTIEISAYEPTPKYRVHAVGCEKLEHGVCTCGLDKRRMDSSAASTDYVMPWVDVSDRELFEERMRIARQAVDEWTRARDHYEPMMNAHYGISVLREEFEELWAEIKAKHPDKGRMREEALQVAAMALAFVLEVCDE